ncbi:MAG: hypothetical protein FD143_14 [Ignavibacteria bacterium]|nr:MAG: hypothetical protein FD143_14 [Ignavibacteria bacterium]KAF0158325.1 MAG: hypothetical protein FD188_2583 [Ignavibacteria bacterium]
MYKNLISETELFSLIPVYSRSIDGWKNKYDSKLKEYLRKNKELYEEQGINFDSKLQLKFEISFNERCAPWRYNDIVAYLELRIYKSDLQFYFYKRENKKYKLDYSFEYEVEQYLEKNIDEQKSFITSAIEVVYKKYPRFKKKYSDIEMFLTTLKYYHNKSKNAT